MKASPDRRDEEFGVAETTMLWSAVLMLLGAFLASGAWLLRRPRARYLMVIGGAGVFAVGVAALTRALP